MIIKKNLTEAEKKSAAPEADVESASTSPALNSEIADAEFDGDEISAYQEEQAEKLTRVMQHGLRRGAKAQVSSKQASLLEVLVAAMQTNYASSYKANLNSIKKGSGKTTNDYVNVLISGLPGTAKTETVETWTRMFNLNLVELSATTLDPTDFSGIPVPRKDRDVARNVRFGGLDALSKPRSVLFLDEYNRAKASIRAPLLRLISSHEMELRGTDYEEHAKKLDSGEEQVTNDSLQQELADAKEQRGQHDVSEWTEIAPGLYREGPAGSGKLARHGQLFFPNMMMTVAAINPSTHQGGTDREAHDLEGAERARFLTYVVDRPDVKDWAYGWLIPKLRWLYEDAKENLNEAQKTFEEYAKKPGNRFEEFVEKIPSNKKFKDEASLKAAYTGFIERQMWGEDSNIPTWWTTVLWELKRKMNMAKVLVQNSKNPAATMIDPDKYSDVNAFYFDDQNDVLARDDQTMPPLTPRTLAYVFNWCDGTKEGFMEAMAAEGYSTSGNNTPADKDRLAALERMFAPFTEESLTLAQDKANDALLNHLYNADIAARHGLKHTDSKKKVDFSKMRAANTQKAAEEAGEAETVDDLEVFRSQLAGSVLNNDFFDDSNTSTGNTK